MDDLTEDNTVCDTDTMAAVPGKEVSVVSKTDIVKRIPETTFK